MDRKTKIKLSEKYYEKLRRLLDYERDRTIITNLYKLAYADEKKHRSTKPDGYPPYPKDFPSPVAGRYFVVKWIFEGVVRQATTDTEATIPLKSLLWTRQDALAGWSIGANYTNKILLEINLPLIEEFLDHDHPDYSDLNKEDVDG